ncbi:hypothetical protein GO755_10525 [Spirosoma sp. HMF4905]|uniref:Uncharacterized protein n=1 Tax=Spirosoma arboris TaxID=2682092 RepID=A0A7K1S9I4_9BACT|nr:hypothetical protein [Spirosoma arboris]MVM30469.1 hypothetical protein [Spirosoma arboris]
MPRIYQQLKIKARQLPKLQTRYYVGEPVIVLPLAEYERLDNHLTDVSLIDTKTQNQQLAVKERHSLMLKDTRANIKSAMAYYKIKFSSTNV